MKYLGIYDLLKHTQNMIETMCPLTFVVKIKVHWT